MQALHKVTPVTADKIFSHRPVAPSTQRKRLRRPSLSKQAIDCVGQSAFTLDASRLKLFFGFDYSVYADIIAQGKSLVNPFFEKS